MDRIHIIGAPAGGHLHRLVREKVVYDHTRIEAELVEVAKELLRQHPRVSVLILECTQMPPFAEAIQRCLGNKVQVYDVCSMVNWFYGGLVRRVPPSWRV
jgi:glutamate racemase